jgi:hypothetical protein
MDEDFDIQVLRTAAGRRRITAYRPDTEHFGPDFKTRKRDA